MIERVLKLLDRGPLTSAKLARELGISFTEAEALIGALLAHGYLREIRVQSCSSCPLAKMCDMSHMCNFRVYVITEKGRQAVSASTQA